MSYFNINRVVLVGRLTRDPELRALPSGPSVCSLRIASNSSRRDASGDYVERPNYFDVSVFGGAAESVGNYMRRGSRVAIDGRLEWREWEAADEQKRQAVSIVADTVQFLDSPAEHSAGTAGADDPDADGARRRRCRRAERVRVLTPRQSRRLVIVPLLRGHSKAERPRSGFGPKRRFFLSSGYSLTQPPGAAPSCGDVLSLLTPRRRSRGSAAASAARGSPWAAATRMSGGRRGMP